MQLIIHAGMHKTGTSAIQRAFARHVADDVAYVPWKYPNHSELVALLFLDPEAVPGFHMFKKRGVAGPDLLEMRETYRKRIGRFLKRPENRDRRIVLSAENITRPDFSTVRRNLHAFFAPLCSDIRVIAYVRPPVSFLHSAFQEKLKWGGLKQLDVARLWPNYRQRFSELDELFGKDRVTLKLFDRAHLAGGDVVQDFAAEIGVAAPPPPEAEPNQSLSLEATALLYLQRSRGDGWVHDLPDAFRRNRGFVNDLAGIGTRRLTFGANLIEPVLAAHRDDIAYVEARLGRPFPDRLRDDTDAIGSGADLIEVARQSHALLRDLVGREAGTGDAATAGPAGPAGPAPDLDAVLRDLDALMRM